MATAWKRAKYLVVLGASAGGLDALKRFFSGIRIPPETAYVVVQHLSPVHDSYMDRLLGAVTNAPIETAEHGKAVLAGHIYLNPKGKILRIHEQHFHVGEYLQGAVLQFPINQLLESVADHYGDHCVAVIVSGTGSDGATGAKRIHEVGGYLLVQSPEEAEFDGMPNSAIATGIVDEVGSAGDLAQAVVDYVLHRSDRSDSQFREMLTEHQRELEEIFRMLEEATGIDFRAYRMSTVSRRLEHRNAILGTKTLKDYVAYLHQNADELRLLQRDLLIGVTQFFRDPSSYVLLKNVLRDQLNQLGEISEYRAWCVACSTGEEAVSLAIVLTELKAELNRNFDFKVFASDVDKESLALAGQSAYPENARVELGEDRFNHFFRPQKSGDLQLVKSVRSKIFYTCHNIISDPPFSNMNLVSCRNLLIYLNPEAQRKVVATLNFSLNQHGVLFLGSAESPGRIENDLDVLSQNHKIYQRRTSQRSSVPLREEKKAMFKPGSLKSCRQADDVVSRGAIHDIITHYLLDEFVPPTVVVSSQLEVVNSFGDLSAYTVPFQPGRMTNNLKSTLVPSMLSAVLSLLQEVGEVGATQSGLFLKESGEGVIEVLIRPLRVRSSELQLFIITFRDVADSNTEELKGRVVPLTGFVDARLGQLESDNRELQVELNSVTRELEAQKQQLQISNEELMASNEELQGTNEELQSVNEELYTINAEYQQKIEELADSNSDLENLLQASAVAIVFLNSSFEVRWFTPEVRRFIKLLPVDAGRCFTDLAIPGCIAERWQEISEVPLNSEPFSFEARISDDDVLVSVSPYYQANQQVDGIVIGFTDISATCNAMRAQQVTESQLARVLDSSEIGAWFYDGNNLFLSQGASRLLNLKRMSLQAISLAELWARVAPDDVSKLAAEFTRSWEQQTELSYSFSTNSLEYNRWLRLEATFKDDFLQGVLLDVSDLKQREQELSTLAIKLRVDNEAQRNTIILNEMRFNMATSLAHEGHWLRSDINSMEAWFSPQMMSMLGYTEETLPHRPFGLIWREAIHPDDRHAFNRRYAQHLTDGEAYTLEYRIRHRDGHYLWVSATTNSFTDPVSGHHSIGGCVADTSLLGEQRRRDALLRAHFDNALHASEMSGYSINHQDGSFVATDTFFALFHFDSADRESMTLEWFDSQIHPDDLPRVRRQREKAVKTGDTMLKVFLFRNGKGDYVRVISRSEVEFDETGKPLANFGTLMLEDGLQRLTRAVTELSKTHN